MFFAFLIIILPLFLSCLGLILSLDKNDRFYFWLFSIDAIIIAFGMCVMSFNQKITHALDPKVDGNVVIVENGKLHSIDYSEHLIIMIDNQVIYKNIFQDYKESEKQ